MLILGSHSRLGQIPKWVWVSAAISVLFLSALVVGILLLAAYLTRSGPI